MFKTKEFDYDLWTTTENGTKHYWARVRATGEVTEISHEVMRFLRSEEKRIYREITSVRDGGSTLSLDVPHDEEMEYWLEDHGFGISEMEIPILEEEFRKLLTPLQLSVFDDCLMGNVTLTDFAKNKGISKQSVSNVVDGIRKKAKRFFG